MVEDISEELFAVKYALRKRIFSISGIAAVGRIKV